MDIPAAEVNGFKPLTIFEHASHHSNLRGIGLLDVGHLKVIHLIKQVARILRQDDLLVTIGYKPYFPDVSCII